MSITSSALRAFCTILVAMAAGMAAGRATATAPVLPGPNRQITLNGTPLGTAIAGRSSYPTLLYDAGTSTYHMWVEVADETAAPDYTPLRIAGFRHATSTDGVAFTSAAALSFAGNPFATTIFGSTYGEPPWIYPKAALWNGRYTLLLWSFNLPGPPGTGDYNYNFSVNDIGTAPGNLALDHYGPLGPTGNGIAGNSAGAFGIVNGVVYFDSNSLLGRSVLTDNGAQAFPAAAGTGPWRATASLTVVADLLTPIGFIECNAVGGNSYVHNDARVIANGDGTLGFFYTVRNCDGSRKSQQIYYTESADNGLTWGVPVGIVSGPVTIGGQPPISGFALADVVVVNGQRVVYFNYQVAGGNLVVGALPPVPVAAAVIPVPVDAPWMLAALFATLALAGTFALRRSLATSH